MTSAVIRWGGVGIELECADTAVLSYIAGQHYCVIEVPGSDASFRLRVDTAAPATPAADFVDERRSFGDWTYRHEFDGEVHTLRSGAGHEAPHQLLTPDWRSWTLRVGSAGAGVIACRVIRELIREHVLSAGAQMCHGSGVLLNTNGAGLLFLGDSGAGKTTLATVLAARQRGWTVATDRVMVARSGAAGEWWMTGIPTTTRLGEGALRALIGEIIPERRSLARQAVDGGAIRDKWPFSNLEAASWLRVGFASASPIAALVVLGRAGPEAPLEITRISGDDAAAAITPHLLGDDRDSPTMWLRPDAGIPPAGPQGADLAGGLPCFRMSWSPARHFPVVEERLIDAMDQSLQLAT
ncbi:MAG TPA: hypothetical protein VFG35_21425 [Actinoplanes sp.]|nr:hypothetical protein [Actinoplanes sp.]